MKKYMYHLLAVIFLFVATFFSSVLAQTQISTIEDLNNIRNNLTGSYELTISLDFASTNSYANPTNMAIYRPSSMADPTATNARVVDAADGLNPGFVPISNFTGTLNGNGFTIQNLYINTGAASYIGLFGQIGTPTSSAGRIESIGLINAYVKGSSVLHAGGLVGRNFGEIINCFTTGTVSAAGTSDVNAGGLVGFSNSTMTNCYATAIVSGSASGTGNARIGGLVGFNNTSGIISNCYATGAVFGAVDAGVLNQGGLVGYNNGGTITNSFWNIETTKQKTSAGNSIGKTTTQLQALNGDDIPAGTPTATTRQSGWGTISWDFGTNNQYPALRTFQGSRQGSLICPQPAPRSQSTCPLLENEEGVIEIATIEDLNRVRNNLAGNYLLTQDLDFASTNSYTSGVVDVAYRPSSTANPIAVGASGV